MFHLCPSAKVLIQKFISQDISYVYSLQGGKHVSITLRLFDGTLLAYKENIEPSNCGLTPLYCSVGGEHKLYSLVATLPIVGGMWNIRFVTLRAIFLFPSF